MHNVFGQPVARVTRSTQIIVIIVIIVCAIVFPRTQLGLSTCTQQVTLTLRHYSTVLRFSSTIHFKQHYSKHYGTMVHPVPGKIL